MYDTIVATLAVGSTYVAMGTQMLRAFDRASVTTLVVTDDLHAFPSNTIVVPYAPDGSHIWQVKRHAVRAGLERAQTVYFVDADYRPREGVTDPLVLTVLPAGATTAWRCPTLANWKGRGLIDVQILACPQLLDQIQVALGAPPWRDIPWWGSDLYAVSRDSAGVWLRFLDAWDRFAHFQPSGACSADARSLFFAGDGIATAFAAAAAGWIPIVNYDAFIPIKRVFCHACAGIDYERALEQAALRPVE